MTTFRPRKLNRQSRRDREEIDKVFLYAIACKITCATLLTGAAREERTTAAAARADFEGRAPHSGLWEIAPMKFAFYWQDTGGSHAERKLHRVEIICSHIPKQPINCDLCPVRGG